MKYKVGDKVKIVDRWTPECSANSLGNMDYWLGKTMTIRSVHNNHYEMSEDCGTWLWYEAAVERLAHKITLNEFLESPVQLCIHCKTKKEFEALARAYNKVDLRWWPYYKGDICCTNHATYCAIEYFKDNNIPIYEFDEVYIPPIEDKEEILIERVGNLTTATYKKNGKEVDKATIQNVAHIVDAAHKVIDELKATYYNGKVVCIDNCGNTQNYTIGKIYQFKDGVMRNNNGSPTPNGGTTIRTFADWAHFTSSKFIEIVE
jgi:hypothetical protein